MQKVDVLSRPKIVVWFPKSRHDFCKMSVLSELVTFYLNSIHLPKLDTFTRTRKKFCDTILYCVLPEINNKVWIRYVWFNFDTCNFHGATFKKIEVLPLNHQPDRHDHIDTPILFYYILIKSWCHNDSYSIWHNSWYLVP